MTKRRLPRSGLHWGPSGVTCFARGLNDVLKNAAFMVLLGSLTPGMAGSFLAAENRLWPILQVIGVMGIGCLYGDRRVLQVLSHWVTALVLFASPLGLPVSTTHVSTGALMGVRWVDRVPPRGEDALRLVLYGWVVTLPVAVAIAAAVAIGSRGMGVRMSLSRAVSGRLSGQDAGRPWQRDDHHEMMAPLRLSHPAMRVSKPC